ncbi:hypothetical protein OH76DRAFT_1401412, partial [Lentinus brumalis]
MACNLPCTTCSGCSEPCGQHTPVVVGPACYLSGQVFSEKYARTHPTLQIYERAIDELLTFEREGGRTTHGHCKMVGSGM